jgi:hypothetical protein
MAAISERNGLAREEDKGGAVLENDEGGGAFICSKMCRV